MSITRTEIARNLQLNAVRLWAAFPLANVVYFNGKTDSGVGATLTSTVAGALVINSITPNVGDRVALTVQTDGYQNGIYEVVSAGDAGSVWQLKRAFDMQSIGQLQPGQYFPVYDGSLAGAILVLINPLPEAIGVDDINFNGNS